MTKTKKSKASKPQLPTLSSLFDTKLKFTLKRVKPDELVINPELNPRTNEHAKGTLKSIGKLGVLTTPLGYEDADGMVHVFAGFGRAAKAVKSKMMLPMRVYPEVNELQLRVLQAAEQNPQRAEWTPLAELTPMLEVLTGTAGDDDVAKAKEYAAFAGMDEKHAINLLVLSKLPADIQQRVDSGGMTLTAAVKLADECALEDGSFDEEKLTAVFESLPGDATRLGNKDIIKACNEWIAAQEESKGEKIKAERNRLPKGKKKNKPAAQQDEEDEEEVAKNTAKGQTAVKPTATALKDIVKVVARALYVGVANNRMTEPPTVKINGATYQWGVAVAMMKNFLYATEGTIAPAGFATTTDDKIRIRLESGAVGVPLIGSVVFDLCAEKSRPKDYEMDADIKAAIDELCSKKKHESIPFAKMIEAGKELALKYNSAKGKGEEAEETDSEEEDAADPADMSDEELRKALRKLGVKVEKNADTDKLLELYADAVG